MSTVRAVMTLAVPSAAAAAFFPKALPYVVGTTLGALLITQVSSRPIYKTRAQKKKEKDNGALVPYSCSKPSKRLSLTTTLPIPGKLETIIVLGGGKWESLASTLAMTMGVRQRPEILSLQDQRLTVPETAAAKAALALCQKTFETEEWAFRHCMRTYLFGACIGDQLGICFDKETLFIGAILHDLAWSETYDRDDLDFELCGAQAAHKFCLKHGLAPHKADVVHEMIALHTSPGSYPRMPDPEMTLVSRGAGVDVAGMFCEEISSKTKNDIVCAHPRLQFKHKCCALLADHAKRKPNTHIAVMCQIGFLKAVQMGPFRE